MKITPYFYHQSVSDIWRASASVLPCWKILIFSARFETANKKTLRAVPDKIQDIPEVYEHHSIRRDNLPDDLSGYTAEIPAR